MTQHHPTSDPAAGPSPDEPATLSGHACIWVGVGFIAFIVAALVAVRYLGGG